MKLEARAVGDSLAIAESVASPGDPGPPPHIHHDGLHEFWYVLEGELEFVVGDHTVVAGPGTFVHVPPGTVHTFSNPGSEPARFIGMFSPAHGLTMVEEFATALPPDGGPPDMARMAEVFRKYSIEVVEPPPP